MATIMPTTFTLRSGQTATIRAATEADTEALLTFLHAGFAAFDTLATGPGEFKLTAEQEREVITKTRNNDRTIMLLAFLNDQIIGECALHCANRSKMAHHGTLGMMVAPGWQGQGIGRALLMTLLNWAATAPGLECVRLGVYETNPAAVRLYESLGFRTEGVQHDFFIKADGSRHNDLSMALWVKPNLAPPGFQTWPVPLQSPESPEGYLTQRTESQRRR